MTMSAVKKDDAIKALTLQKKMEEETEDEWTQGVK